MEHFGYNILYKKVENKKSTTGYTVDSICYDTAYYS